MLTADSFLETIEKFIADTGTSASAFGRAALGDPNFVGDLRAGRMPNLRIVARVSEYIGAHTATDEASLVPEQSSDLEKAS